ncbi:nucleotide exchange factor GrpE [Peptoniphilus raoultii]|uniref:nucleotide exchange factor GrpE n=1 Tax=Peptoniphilus raoultii TaxID=1776387 RepID=UPI0008DAC1C2|nr:nucleotide exchange factor GrpE [Peptoniphilus raoultii]
MADKNKKIDEELKENKEDESLDENLKDSSDLGGGEFEIPIADDIEIIEENEENPKEDERLKDLTDKFMRLQADFTNFKRRTEKEKSSYIDLGISKIASSILPVIDNFERSMDAETEHDGFYEGIILIKSQLIDALKANGIVEMKAKGEKFDPNFHHAVMTEKSDEYEEGIVTEVLQKGYLINDKVLRPAMVKVSE